MLYLPKTPPKISVEFTSPSNPLAEKTIFQAASCLKHYELDYYCVNFGGDVIAPDRASKITHKLATQHYLPVIGYLRRTNVSADKLNALADYYIQRTISTLFITEGRRLNTAAISTDHYASLIQAVKSLKKHSNIKISVEARPEHTNTEIDMIRQLIDLGVDEIVTRFSFNPNLTLRFLEKVSQTHTLPKIRIGILPFENPSKTFLTAHRLNVSVPHDLQRIFGQYSDNDTINISLGMHLLLQQVQYYMQAGYDHFHVRFGRSHLPIDALCRYYNIPYHAPCDTLKNLTFKTKIV